MPLSDTLCAMRNKGPWFDALVVSAIVAIGVVVAGLTSNPPPENEPFTPGYVSEPVDYRTDIPGCDTVYPPEPDRAYATVGAIGVEPVYNDPANPWLDSEKARTMSDAVRESLPSSVSIVELDPATARFSNQPLVFQPIPELDPSLGIDPGKTAEAVVERNGIDGAIGVNVSRSEPGPLPCRADLVDSRETRSDGTIVDMQDTWSEYDGVRTSSNVVRVYAPDGTRIIASASNRDSNHQPIGAVPLSIRELVDLATLPDLQWSKS